VQVVKDDLLELLVHLLLLTKDHVPLPLDGRLVELRVLENVREDVNGLVDVLVERLGVVDSLLAGGVGVEVGAEVLDLELELGLVARLGALEGEVLGTSARNASISSRVSPCVGLSLPSLLC
jgi:hypothetical protein